MTRRRIGRAERGQHTSGVGPPGAQGSDEAATDTQPLDAVVEALRAWRLQEARRRATPPFVILHDRTVAAIATALPRSIVELHAVPGIGPAKVAVYGDAILSVVAATVATAKT